MTKQPNKQTNTHPVTNPGQGNQSNTQERKESKTEERKRNQTTKQRDERRRNIMNTNMGRNSTMKANAHAGRVPAVLCKAGTGYDHCLFVCVLSVCAFASFSACLLLCLLAIFIQLRLFVCVFVRLLLS